VEREKHLNRLSRAAVQSPSMKIFLTTCYIDVQRKGAAHPATGQKDLCKVGWHTWP